MGKITILFIIVASYAIFAYSKMFHGYCDPIVNEDVCIDNKYFENLAMPKSFQVIAYMKFNGIKGVNLFNSHLNRSLVATISKDEKELVFSINCFKIPFKIKYQKHVNFRLKFKKCSIFDGDFKEANDQTHVLFNYINKSPILMSFYKIDNYLTIWGCNSNLEHISDRAVWILLDNDGDIEYDTEKLRSQLDDFLKKIKTILNKNGLAQLNSGLFTINNITTDNYSCYDTFDQKDVSQYAMKDIPKQMTRLNASHQTTESIDETKLKFTVALLMVTGHVLFMVGFFTIGYQIVIRCYKE